jgi:hypothetical protein
LGGGGEFSYLNNDTLQYFIIDSDTKVAYNDTHQVLRLAMQNGEEEVKHERKARGQGFQSHHDH